MKILYIRQLTLAFLITLFGTGCEDFLEEDSISNQTADGYYVDAKGFEDLVRSSYTLLRDIHRDRDLVLLGTDLFTQGGWSEAVSGGAQGNPLNAYDIRFNASSVGSGLWDKLYREIGRTNTVIGRADNVTDMDESLKAVRIGEAKFLRAFSYFYLVQQWGEIPMPLEESTTASREVTKIPAAEVYSQIISDLTEAEADLPAKGDAVFGRATKGAAQFLLARVYLTRGWNFNNSLGGSAADFDKAVEYADKIISAYPMDPEYKNLFPLRSENPLEETFPTQNAENDEIVFAVQYGDNVLTNNGDPTEGSYPGNDAHSIFGGGAEDIPGEKGRTNDYNRHLGIYITTPATYRLFDPDIDTRYEHNFVEAMYALSDVSDFSPTSDGPTINIAQGDTVLYFSPWNDPASLSEKGLDVGGTKPYAVINTDEIGILEESPYHSRFKTPLMWKFWEPGIPYSDSEGTFDLALFRSAEAYLIAAEAIVKGASFGNMGGADVYYNTVVDRALGDNVGAVPMKAASPADLGSLAAVSYRATPGNLDIDMILDERARELMGEYTRWFDLKRTEKLIERTTLMNPWTAEVGQIEEIHYLRPIPLSEIDRSLPTIAQNPGYN